MDLPLSNSRTYAFPQIIVNQFQIPIHRVTILSLFTYIEWHLLELKWPNPISNPIHGHPCFGTFEDRQGLTYTPIQFQIPILRFAIISIPRNDITHRIWPDPISNPIYGNLCFDIFKGRQDLRYTPIQFLTPILRLAFISISSFWKSGPNWYVFSISGRLGSSIEKKSAGGFGSDRSVEIFD